MYCEKCGTKLPDNNICPKCSQEAAAQQSQGGQGQGYPPPGYQQPDFRQPAYTQRQGGYDVEHGIQRKPVNCILLSIVTCGIYYLYWMWVTNKQINQLAGKEIVSGGMLILGWFCLPVTWYNWYRWDNAIQDFSKQYGVRYSANFILWIILTVVAGVGNFVMIFQIQDTLNNIYAR